MGGAGATMSLSIEWRFRDTDTLSVLAGLKDQRLYMKAIDAAAKSYREDVLKYVAEGKSFTDRGKHLKFIKLNFPPGPSAMVYTKAKHLVWMEGGTGPHPIAPRDHGGKKRGRGRGHKVLAFNEGGEGGSLLFRKLVNHPGTRPIPFFFADMPAREARMMQAMRRVIASGMEGSR